MTTISIFHVFLNIFTNRSTRKIQLPQSVHGFRAWYIPGLLCVAVAVPRLRMRFWNSQPFRLWAQSDSFATSTSNFWRDTMVCPLPSATIAQWRCQCCYRTCSDEAIVVPLERLPAYRYNTLLSARNEKERSKNHVLHVVEEQIRKETHDSIP